MASETEGRDQDPVEDTVEKTVEETKAQPAPPPLPESLPDEVREALEALDEHKSQHTVVLDMRRVSAFTDFMIVCTGRSEPHARALAESVCERLLGQGIKPSHVEGKSDGNWILLDFMQLIVHVFTPEKRSFYQLEKLWRDAPLLEWGVPAEDPAQQPAPAEKAADAEA